jgi:hypothetical protein
LPCQYEKLHHVRSLREEISELQAELSEAKGNSLLNTSASMISPRWELERTGLRAGPTGSQPYRSTPGSERDEVATRPGGVLDRRERFHDTRPSNLCSQTYQDITTRTSLTPGVHQGEGLVQADTSSMVRTVTNCGTDGHFHGQSMHSSF